MFQDLLPSLDLRPTKAAIATGAAALVAGGILYHQVATYFERKNPPNEIITVQVPQNREIPSYSAQFHVKHRFHPSENPTIVFEAGLGATGSTFSFLQDKLSKEYPTFSYDRLGMGWSSRAPNDIPRDARQICHELQCLLDEARVSRPLILVGHSYGGIITRTYVSMFPEEVAGLVLLDASNEVYFAGEPDLVQKLQQQVKAAPVALTILHLGVTRFLNATGILGFALKRGAGSATIIERPKSLNAFLKTQSWPQTFSGTVSEMRYLPQSLENVRENCSSLGERVPDLAASVVCARHHPGMPSEKLFFETQEEMARSSNSNSKNKDTFQVDEDSNHWSVLTSDVSLRAIQRVASICKEELKSQALAAAQH